ncbi:Rrf2 family transcriptional regulator [Myxococcus stipitatus]|uniref:Rrf2 family transcriptional regulator n=1 Tax=Myxococcus stipitatus TaxID=83455 RepID=UPI001F295B4E|nr:Rrf2 family transcriptional regulator [Myxococcus stipitatus]MCE9672282.1 Rrf2 family transcriptional regulator [Myxococcus stipitatus]
MRRDSRLSVALHVLLHLPELGPVVTSEQMGRLLKANPVVVRRTMAGLREAGILRSEKGHGGGWSLARKLESVTLADVYEALGAPTLFSIGPRDESPGCFVEQAVNGALGKALEDAEALLLARLRGTTLADVAASVRRDAARAPRSGSRRTS